MNTDKIPTAELTDWQIRDYISKLVDNNCKEIPWEGMEVDKATIKQEFMEFLKNYRVEFAKLHVKAALETASNMACLTPFAQEFMQEGADEAINKDSILNAYPENLIK